MPARRLSREAAQEDTPRIVYRSWRKEIARMLCEGYSVKGVHSALLKAKANITYSTLARYVSEETWGGLGEEDGIELELLVSEPQVTKSRTSKKIKTPPAKKPENIEDDHEPLQPGKNASKPKTFTLRSSHEFDESELF